MSSDSSVVHPFRFLVAEIDEAKSPMRVILEGEDWNRTMAEAFNMARDIIHNDRAVVTAVFEVHDGYRELRATAGYSRFHTLGRWGDFDTLGLLLAVMA
jgi:hypothetical protein